MIYINLLIIFLFLVFIHELGHYFTARFFGLKVTDFSVGFGKTLFQYKDRNNTNWKLSLIPLGGFVKIKGLESIFKQDSDKDYDSDSFLSLHLFKKIIILLAGSVFNIVSERCVCLRLTQGLWDSFWFDELPDLRYISSVCSNVVSTRFLQTVKQE